MTACVSIPTFRRPKSRQKKDTDSTALNDCNQKLRVKQTFELLRLQKTLMFETTESTRVEMYEYDNNLCIAHTIRLTTVALAIGW